MHKALDYRGRCVVITGAAGGIGRGLAQSFAAVGATLELLDRDADALARLADEFAGDTPLHCTALDLGDRQAVQQYADDLACRGLNADVLVNNAGVALSGRFDQLSADEFDWLIDINFNGVVRMTRAFLPLLATRDEARLVNLSSLFGLIAPPGQTAYSAAKFAVRGFSESLRNELLATGSPVGVTRAA